MDLEVSRGADLASKLSEETPALSGSPHHAGATLHAEESVTQSDKTLLRVCRQAALPNFSQVS